MASYHPKKKYLSQQDTPPSIANGSLGVSDQTSISNAICTTPSSGSLTSSSRVSSLLLSDYQRSLSDNDLKFLGSPTLLGNFCNSGLSLDTIEKICSEQEAYNTENGETSGVASSYPCSLPLTASSSNVLGRDFVLDDLALLSSLHKSCTSAEEPRISAIHRDSAEIAQDVLLPSLPSLSSFSSLSEIELNAHPSTGSFSSILNGLDACEQAVAPVGSAVKNILAGHEEQLRSAGLSDLLTSYESSSVNTGPVPPPTPQNELPSVKYRIKHNSSALDNRNGYSTIPVPDSNHISTQTGNEPMVCIKEEADEVTNEVKQVQVTTSGRNRGSGKSRDPKYECQVCGDVAAGYHCGAYVCEACKKFYLRCLKTRGAPAFLCPKNNDCEITKDTRSHCQFCRFQKCISLGMYRPGNEDDKKLKVNFKVIPCKVCNAPSSGFHFGAITCEGCKGFFRRMLKEQLHKKFICVNDEPCRIDSANRTTCKCCRFEKCLKVGMTLDGTRLGRQSNSVKRCTLMQYVAGDQINLQNNFEMHARGANDDLTDDGNAANSRCTTGHLEENEDSSEPLCINFPSDRSSRKRHLSSSSGNSVHENTNLHLENLKFECGDYMVEDDTNFLHYKTGNRNRCSSPPRMRSAKENPNHIYVPLDKRKLLDNNEYRVSREKASYCSAGDEASALFYSHNRGTSNVRDQDFLLSNKNSDRLNLNGLMPQKFFERCNDWNNSTSEGLQLYVEQSSETSGRNCVAVRSRVNMGSYLDDNPCTLPVGMRKNTAGGVLESAEFQSLEDATGSSWSGQQFSSSRGSSARNDQLKIHIPPTADAAVPESVAQSVSPDFSITSVFNKSPEVLFGLLVTAFRELEDINLRPPDLDELHHQPVSMQTIWKLVEIPFIHQSKIILKFIKKVPGFRLLVIEDQIKIAQDSLYPVLLLYHSRSYDLETEEFRWFICSPKEHDLVLSVLTPFRSMANHFRSIGHIIKRLNLSEEELAFISAMAVLTASEGSPLRCSKKVAELQDCLVEAFVSYLQRDSGGRSSQKRIGELLARLPELKRANIEHRLIIAQVEQMIPEIEISNLYREIFLSG